MFSWKNIWQIATTIIAAISILKLFGDFRIITLSQYFINVIESYKALVYPLLSFLDNLFVVNEYTKDWIFASFFLIDQVFFRFSKAKNYKWVEKFYKTKEDQQKYNKYVVMLEKKVLAFLFALFMGIGVSGAYYIGPFESKVNDFFNLDNTIESGGHEILLPMLGVMFVVVPFFILIKSLIFNIYIPIVKILLYSILSYIPVFKNFWKKLLKTAWGKLNEGEQILKDKLTVTFDLMLYSLKIAFIIFLLLGLNFFFFLAES